MKRTIYRDFIIDYDNLGRLYVHNRKSPYSEESDKKYVSDWSTYDPDKQLTGLQAAKQLVDEEIELQAKDLMQYLAETIDDYGKTDWTFQSTPHGNKIIRGIEFTKSDIDETGHDFTDEFYLKTISEAIVEGKVEDL